MQTRGCIQMGAGHPTGFYWGTEVDCWDGRRYIRPGSRQGAEVGAMSSLKVEYYGIGKSRTANRLYDHGTRLILYPW